MYGKSVGLRKATSNLRPLGIDTVAGKWMGIQKLLLTLLFSLIYLYKAIETGVGNAVVRQGFFPSVTYPVQS